MEAGRLLEPGFQLSFAAVAAIFVLVPRLAAALEGYPLPAWLRDALAVSAACGAATAPILWLQFGDVPVYSLPRTRSWRLRSGRCSDSRSRPLLEPVSPSAAVALAWLDGWLAAYIAPVRGSSRGCRSPRSTRAGRRPCCSASRVAAARASAASALAAAGWRSRRRDRRSRAARLAALPARAAAAADGLRITFLDVGQGDAILLQVPEGAVLVDQGPPEADVAQQLRALGVRRLAALVLTHPQRDHIGGAEDVLRRMRVDRVLDPRLGGSRATGAPRWPPQRARRPGRRDACRRHVPARPAAAARALAGRAGTAGDDPNRLAIVLLASYGDVDVLLTADAETDVTAPLLPRHVEILKVAHHGSADPGLASELRELRPTSPSSRAAAGTTTATRAP